MGIILIIRIIYIFFLIYSFVRGQLFKCIMCGNKEIFYFLKKKIILLYIIEMVITRTLIGFISVDIGIELFIFSKYINIFLYN